MTKTSKQGSIYMLMAFAGYSIFGFSFLFSKLAMDVAEPFVLLTIRFLTAFLVMNILRLTGVVTCGFHGKNVKPLIILGLYQPVMYFICESYGIKFSSSSFAGIIISLVPIVGLFFGSVFLKEIPTKQQVAFSILSVAGVLLLTMTGEIGGFALKGFLLLLGAVASGAMFSIQSRKTAEDFTAFERTYIMFAIGTIAFGIMAVIRTRGDLSLWTTPLKDGGFWISIMYLSIVSSIGAFMLINKALDVLDVARTLVFSNITTVISVLAGVLILHEHFAGMQMVGIMMVIIGVYGVNR